MKKSGIKFFDKIIVVLLGFLGMFYSCRQPCEYGTPHGEYVLKGIITDKETHKPIQNIQIGEYVKIYTDADGKYVIYNNSPNFHLRIDDIDGEENDGYFHSKEIEGQFTQADQIEKGDGEWYKGKFVKTRNIELEKREIFIPEYGVRPAPFEE